MSKERKDSKLKIAKGRLRNAIPAVVSVMVLSSCASGYGVEIVTPDIVEYSPEVQEEARRELENLGPPCPRDVVFGGCSALNRMIKDYGYMRDQTRALNDLVIGQQTGEPITEP